MQNFINISWYYSLEGVKKSQTARIKMKAKCDANDTMRREKKDATTTIPDLCNWIHIDKVNVPSIFLCTSRCFWCLISLSCSLVLSCYTICVFVWNPRDINVRKREVFPFCNEKPTIALSNSTHPTTSQICRMSVYIITSQVSFGWMTNRKNISLLTYISRRLTKFYFYQHFKLYAESKSSFFSTSGHSPINSVVERMLLKNSTLKNAELENSRNFLIKMQTTQSEMNRRNWHFFCYFYNLINFICIRMNEKRERIQSIDNYKPWHVNKMGLCTDISIRETMIVTSCRAVGLLTWIKLIKEWNWSFLFVKSVT